MSSESERLSWHQGFFKKLGDSSRGSKEILVGLAIERGLTQAGLYATPEQLKIIETEVFIAL
jgi:hypothetical protein